MDEVTIKEEVRKRYAAIARQGDCACGPCCDGEGEAGGLVHYGDLAQDVPQGADLGLGCGIPTRRAALHPGQVVLDLGSGAGIDAFIASKEVGPEGRVIGVDMTPEMIERARRNAAQGGYANVEFRLGEIEALPVADASVDVVISNCVVNLAPDKKRVFTEILRVLRPGGRFAIADVVTQGEVPEAIRQDVGRWAGCISGALDLDEYLDLARQAGFRDVTVGDLRVSDDLGGEGYHYASAIIEGRKA
jgi:SAM-dependent methyltransferase